MAGKLGTFFIEIHSDNDLAKIKAEYIKKGEIIFADLEKLLAEDDYGITIRLKNRLPWEHEFISIIDCRNTKVNRSYYTKWHEIAHFLILTDQMRLSFKRTLHLQDRDPEEALVDIIAGKFGFYSPIIHKHTYKEISFDSIDNLRNQLCPEASNQASLIGFVNAFKKPCLLVHGKTALKKHEEKQLNQMNFDFEESPKSVLRATKVTVNDAAKNEGLFIYPNMRIPEESIISKIFNDKDFYGEANENLSWWRTSDGSILPNVNVYVMAKRFNDSIYAIITPIIKYN